MANDKKKEKEKSTEVKVELVTMKTHSKDLHKNIYGEKIIAVPEDSFDEDGNTESAVGGTYRNA